MTNISKKTVWRVLDWRVLRALFCTLTLLATAPLAMASGVPQKSFTSPDNAVSALVNAVKANDQSALRAIFGPRSGKLTNSGDPAADERARENFVSAYREANKLSHEGDAKVVLVIGKDEWPFPIPLVRGDGGWRFDTQQGEQEILNRRIGRNELSAIQVCLAIVDAEREYATQDWDGDGVFDYAPRIASTPGKLDGLYWPAKEGEPASPLGPLVAAAAKEKSGASQLTAPLAPYHGYYYKILTKQGKDAKGGEYDYFVKGKMIGGFALVAYPSRYGSSGIMTFIVNQDGVIYEKDLGKKTASIASNMTTFNPDASWKQP